MTTRIYCCEATWGLWQERVQHATDDEELKKVLAAMYSLDEQLKGAIAGVHRALRMMTKIRIRYKKLLYEGMEVALELDEAKGKGGVAMDVLLHPSWN
jgi:citrate synthase